MASQLKLELTISGKVGKFPFEPVVATYEVTGQEVATGPKSVTVAAGAPAASVSVCLEPMGEQSVLVICSDKPVTYQLNGDGVDREINANGFAVHPGDPVVTSLAFGNPGTQQAVVTVFQLGLAGSVPVGSAAGALLPPLRDIGPSVAAQTDFTLPVEPLDPTRVLLFIEGVMYSSFTISGTTLTWTGAALLGGERVEVLYR